MPQLLGFLNGSNRGIRSRSRMPIRNGKTSAGRDPAASAIDLGGLAVRKSGQPVELQVLERSESSCHPPFLLADLAPLDAKVKMVIHCYHNE